MSYFYVTQALRVPGMGTIMCSGKIHKLKFLVRSIEAAMCGLLDESRLSNLRTKAIHGDVYIYEYSMYDLLADQSSVSATVLLCQIVKIVKEWRLSEIQTLSASSGWTAGADGPVDRIIRMRKVIAGADKYVRKLLTNGPRGPNLLGLTLLEDVPAT